MDVPALGDEGVSRGVSTWGASKVVDRLRMLLVHRILSEEVTEEHLLPLTRGVENCDWRCDRVRVLGPKEGDGSYDPHRITVYVSAERRVADVSLG